MEQQEYQAPTPGNDNGQIFDGFPNQAPPASGSPAQYSPAPSTQPSGPVGNSQAGVNPAGGYPTTGAPSSYQNNQGDNKFNNYTRKPSKPAEVYLAYGISLDKDTPNEVIAQIEPLARLLESRGFTMRMHAPDKANPEQAKVINYSTRHEQVLPWKEFDDLKGDYFTTNPGKDLTKLVIPSFDKIPDTVKSIAAHKTHVVLGKFLNSPISLLLTWTPDGCEHARNIGKTTGFTRDTIRLCSIYGIQIINMNNPGTEQRVSEFLDKFIPYTSTNT